MISPGTGGGQIERAVRRLGPWFHNLRLPGGIQTAPAHTLGDFPSFKWDLIHPHLPQDLTGWKALDIGCNAGFYSFELARRGAEVTAIDVDPRYLRQARWAARQYGLTHKVNFRCLDIYALARMKTRFDLTMFMGVFYHLRHPLLGLDLVNQRTSQLMVFQTLTLPGEDVYEGDMDLPFEERQTLHELAWPKMAFIEHHFAGDPTNWWVPNRTGVEAMLRSSGWKIRARPDPEIYVCTPLSSRPHPDSRWPTIERRE